MILQIKIKKKSLHMSCEHCEAPEWSQLKKVLVFAGSNGEVWARGLTKTLAAQFYPSFCVKHLAVTEPSRPAQGRKRGRAYDAAVTRWVDTGKRAPSLDRLKDELAQRGWKTVRTQVPVGCRQLRLATRLDLVCEDREGRLVLLEIKTGYQHNWTVASAEKFLPPFQEIELTCRQISFMQLAFSQFLWHHNHQKTLPLAYLVHVQEQSICFEELPSVYLSHMDQAVAQLATSVHDNRQTRTKLLRKKRRKANPKKQK